MRILNLIPHISGGGAERQLAYVSAELARRGHEVSVIHLDFSHRAKRSSMAGVDLIPVAVESPFEAKILVAVTGEMRRLKPDVVVSWSLPMDIVGAVACRLTSTPLIVREPTSEEYYLDVKWKAALRLMVVRVALRAVIANSQSGAAYWRESVPGVSVHVIPNAIDHGAAGASRREPPPVPPHVVSAGRLLDMKNVDVLIQAVASMRDVPFSVDVLGDGPARASLEDLARRLGVRDRITFHGTVNDVCTRLRRASAVVSLSSFEGRPNAVLEAMATGAPLVVSDIAAHREIVDGRSAILVPLRDAGAVERALREIFRDPAGADSRASVARAATANWTVATVTDQFERLLETVVAKGSA